MNEEQSRVDLLKSSLTLIHGFLAKLEEKIDSAREDFRILNKGVNEIQSLLLLYISQISLSRDLLSFAESQPFNRFQAFLGLRETQRFDIVTREAQLEVLSASNATMTVTIRELTVMANVVRHRKNDLNLKNDFKSMKDTLGEYERLLTEGRLSVGGLLRAVRVGFDALARGREHFLAREDEFLAREDELQKERMKELHDKYAPR